MDPLFWASNYCHWRCPQMEAAAFFLDGEELCSSAAGGQKGEMWHWLEAWELVLFRISSTSTAIGSHPVSQACARAHTHACTHTAHTFSLGHFLTQGPVSRPRPPLPLLTHRPQGLPTCRPAGSLGPRKSRAFCEVSPWTQRSEPPSQLTKVSYSLFCQILWSTKYFEFYVNIVLALFHG